MKMDSKNFTCVLPLSSEVRARICHILIYVLTSLGFIYILIHKEKDQQYKTNEIYLGLLRVIFTLIYF